MSFFSIYTRSWFSLAGGCAVGYLVKANAWGIPLVGAWVLVLVLLSPLSRHYRDYLGAMGKTTHMASNGDIAAYLGLQLVWVAFLTAAGFVLGRLCLPQ